MNRLPSGYRMIESLDFVRNRKQMMIVFALSTAIIVVMLAIGLIAKPIAVSWRFMIIWWNMRRTNTGIAWPGLF